MSPILYRLHPSPLGPMLFRAQGERLTGLYFVGQRHEPKVGENWTEDTGSRVLQQAVREVDEFFAHERKEFEVALGAMGTLFQQNVWQQISAIPHGKTKTYGEIARNLGSPGAVRAVGAATGRNPITLIVPCHRVVGSAGALTGYAGGLDRKQKLLALERAEIFASCTA